MQRAWTMEQIAREVADFDWSKVDAKTEEEIVAAALSDPDSALPTDEELAAFKRVRTDDTQKTPPKEAAE